jgi:hypothetical protein
MIAARCRNPAVRQEAVDLLIRARRREGFWDSTVVEKIVSTTIELEQAGARNSQTVPDDDRIREVKLHFEGERGAQLVFITVGQWRKKQGGYQRLIQW